MGNSIALTPEVRRRLAIIRLTLNVARHWLLVFIVLLGIYNLLPFAAPVAMRLGWTAAGDTIYTVYSTMCHQMAQRSFFLFGPQAMVDIAQLPLSLSDSSFAQQMQLRLFQGSPEIGWKVAWSDRMVYMYGSLWIASIVYWLLSRSGARKPISIWLFALLMLPMALDGVTHVVSDLNGLTEGFRYRNEWLASLTGYALPASFYAGDALGSFNSWMRLISGIAFGVGAAWLALPLIDREARRTARLLHEKLAYAHARLSQIDGQPV